MGDEGSKEGEGLSPEVRHELLNFLGRKLDTWDFEQVKIILARKVVKKGDSRPSS